MEVLADILFLSEADHLVGTCTSGVSDTAAAIMLVRVVCVPFVRVTSEVFGALLGHHAKAVTHNAMPLCGVVAAHNSRDFDGIIREETE